jgi:aminopeptidase N
MIDVNTPVTGAAALLVVTLGAALGAQAPAAPHPYRPGIDVVDYDLTVDLPERGRVIEGRAVLAVRRTGPVDTLTLDLLRLRVDSVLVNGRPVAFRRDSATIAVPLAAGTRPAPALPGGARPRGGAGAPPQQQDVASGGQVQNPSVAGAIAESLTVTVRYGGEVADGLIVTESAGRWMAFGDNWPNRARNWIPSVDHPSDKATVSWTVHAPSGRRVVANGELLEETPLGSGDRTRTRWRETRPIPVYLMVIAAAPLAFYDLGPAACARAEVPGCVRQSVYVAPESRDFLPGPFAHATDIVDFFAALVGPFPYEKLAHLQSSTRFGGMENASAIFYADKLFRDRSLGPGLIAHETAHQWFGDAVTEREWSHLWLSEGFASYLEPLWVRHAAGDSAFRATMAKLRAEIVASPVTAERPVLDTAQTDYLKLLNTNSYQKGAWVLHMLRTVVGDSAFFRGVRSYYARHRHGTALTEDLRREMEGASGTDLGWFFDQWLRRPGVVELTTGWRHDPKSRRMTVTLGQGGRFAPYRFPLTVEVVDSDGTLRRATVAVPAERRVEVQLPFALAGRPRRVTFDPDVELLARFLGDRGGRP